VTAHPTADWIAQQITEAFPGTRRPGIRKLRRDRHLEQTGATSRSNNAIIGWQAGCSLWLSMANSQIFAQTDRLGQSGRGGRGATFGIGREDANRSVNYEFATHR